MNFGRIFSELGISKSHNSLEETSEIIREIEQLTEMVRKHPLQQGGELDSEVYFRLDSSVFSLLNDSAFSEAVTQKLLTLYRDSLKKIVAFQDKSYSMIEQYIKAVNQMLIGKQIVTDFTNSSSKISLLKLAYPDRIPIGDLKCLSSGERQILTLFYAITQMSSQKVILIDEPEISIHVDTQSLLLESISSLSLSKQIIACTHAPRIASNQLDRLKEIVPIETDQERWKIDDSYQFDSNSTDSSEEDYEFVGNENDSNDEDYEFTRQEK